MSAYYVLFFTHSGAIQFQRKMEKRGILCDLMPVPRRLSSNCGVCAKIEYDTDVLELVDDEIEQIYEIKGSEMIRKYDNE
ncbi:DUF3343 domain-containing protein [Fusibacter tunisiensis]|uniref:Putative Se/S carrier protein-like domain-containing protein n=1 Tax=Fusibacter tunisiensis TaxID=1008308 RepID=A0ABS2MSQ3_9FIRM|nr:DUF3343 domain-containing protein [Fusibacter tunisiensis]MBM7562424.1 hypothetical protein [Fusibacter tunisiensis]